MSVHDLQAQFAAKAPNFVHVAYDRTSGWWRIFTADASYGGAPWLDEAEKTARQAAVALGKEVKVHMRRKR